MTTEPKVSLPESFLLFMCTLLKFSIWIFSMYMKIYTMQDEFMGGGWSAAILKEINTDA